MISNNVSSDYKIQPGFLLADKEVSTDLVRIIAKFLDANDLAHMHLVSSKVFGQFVSQMSFLQISKSFFITKFSDSLLSHIPNLTSLKFNKCTRKTNASLQKLSSSLAIRELNFAWCGRQFGNINLHGLSNFTHLQSLNLKACEMSGVYALSSLTALQSLILERCDLKSEIFRDLSSLPNLKILNLSTCQILDRDLSALTNMTTLRGLSLACCTQITDASVRVLAPLTTLQSLNLTYCFRLTDKSLSTLSKFPLLQDLNLHQCGFITDKGLSVLTSLTALKTLNLSQCEKITKAGLRGLSSLFSLQNLELRSFEFETGVSPVL